MRGKKNELVEALFRTLASQHERWSICPGDDLLSLTPLADVGAACEREQTSRGVAAGAPERACVVSGSNCDPDAPTASDNQAPHLLTGGHLSNVTENSVVKPTDMPRYTGSYDGGCAVSYYGIWFAGDMEAQREIMDDLAFYKAQAQAGGRYLENPVFTILNGQQWEVCPRGSNGEVRYNYQIRRGGVTLLVHQNPGENIAGVRAVFGYEALTGRDLDDVNRETKEFLAAIGFDVVREKLSRVDMNVTLGVDFSWVQKAYEEGRVVSRVRRWRQYGRNTEEGYVLETIMGGGHLQAVVYDKLRECLDKREEAKLDDLSDVLGDPCAENAGLTRVEFRFRRSALKAFEINSVKDFTSRIVDVVEYLTSHWFRILADRKIRGKENRQDVANEWRWVQYAFYSTFCEGKLSQTPLKTRNMKRIDRKNVFRQALGCVSSAFAYDANSETLSFEEFSAKVREFISLALPELFKQYMQKRGWFQTVKQGVRDAATQYVLYERPRPKVIEVPF